MPEEPDPLDSLTESVADGESIDWDVLREGVSDEASRRLLDHLRIIAGVGDVHRSMVDESVHAQAIPADLEATPAAEPDIGRRWGHLLLVRKIGQGTFGVVYEALDTWLDHPRALKLLRPEVAERISAQQILHEARKLVRVRHPNVVTVHGADRHDGRIGFWMDLIEGQTLEAQVARGRLSAGEATYVGQEVCGALAAVHHANQLHRDVKAQNVMRASDGGRIILMDFGAGEFRDAPTLDSHQGTPLYLAPELFNGGRASVQTDIYALGVLLYYLVTSRFPVEATSMPALEQAHHRGGRRRLRDARPDLPPVFVDAVERAIDPDPAQRFESAGDFHAALGNAARAYPHAFTEPAPRVATDQNPTAGSSTTIVIADGVIRWFRYAGFAALAALGIAVCGFVAARTFEVALHVDTAFRAGPADFFRIGREGLLPFAINWLAGGAVVALLVGLRPFLGSSVNRALTAGADRLARIPAPTVAAALALSALAGWAAIAWTYRSVFYAVIALQETVFDARGVASGGSLGPWFVRAYLAYSEWSAVLSFAIALALAFWFPRLERHADDVGAVGRMRWVAVGVLAALIICSVAPRRLALDRFEAVIVDSRPSLVIGSRGDELLVYSADGAVSRRERLRRDSTRLTRQDIPRRLADPAPAAPVEGR